MPKSKKQLEHTHTFIDENLSGYTHIYSPIIKKVQLEDYGGRMVLLQEHCQDIQIKFTIKQKKHRSKLDGKSINTQYC